MERNTSIRIDKIDAVLLDDGWHIVEPGTFDVGEYSFIDPPKKDGSSMIVGGPIPGAQDRLWVTWKERDGSEIAASLTSVHAIRFKQED